MDRFLNRALSFAAVALFALISARLVSQDLRYGAVVLFVALAFGVPAVLSRRRMRRLLLSGDVPRILGTWKGSLQRVTYPETMAPLMTATAYAAYGPPSGYAGPALASWGARVGASLLDGLVMYIPLSIGYVALMGGLISQASGLEAGQAAPAPAAGAVLAFLVGSLVTLALWIWNRGIRQGGTGQSIGKKALGIRLLKEADGRPMGTGMALLRDVVHVVDSAPMDIGYLWPLWDPKKQTFADKIVATVVVKG